MKNLLLNELNRMKYLTNHERGVVISEQKIVLKEQEEPTFDDLLWNLQNDRLKDFKFDIGRSNLTTEDTSYVAVEHKRDLLFLQKNPQTVFKYKKGELSKVGTWKWVIDLESTSKWKYKLVIVPTNTSTTNTITTDATTATNITTDATTATNTTQKEKLRSPIDKNLLIDPNLKVEDGNINFRLKNPEIETNIYAPVTGKVQIKNSWFDFDTNGTPIYVTDDTIYKVKNGDSVKKGDIVAILPAKADRNQRFERIWTGVYWAKPEDFE
jgi:biotin carboxyl carrier protein